MQKRRGRGPGKKPKTIKECENCGAMFVIVPSRLATARACSRKCLGVIQSQERTGNWYSGSDAPGWKGGVAWYRTQRKEACERCGATEKLLVHHRNENRSDNSLENLETLCRRCHQHHHGAVEIMLAAKRAKGMIP